MASARDNYRYSKPHIEMSSGVEISLVTLRTCLVCPASAILYRFASMQKGEIADDCRIGK